jgi:AraC-like DNA-binding protein
MSDAARDLIGQRLQARMTCQHDYRENDITLGTLAERIGTRPNLVSHYLNDGLKTSFFDYVNGYRVAAVERKIIDPATGDMSLLDMALASGFNGKSTFNAAFKRVHGVAPSVWRSANLKLTSAGTE